MELDCKALLCNSNNKVVDVSGMFAYFAGGIMLETEVGTESFLLQLVFLFTIFNIYFGSDPESAVY